MKKTLFIALVLPLAASVSVLNAAEYETGTEKGTYFFAYLKGDLSLNQDSDVPEDLGFNGAFCVGTHNGEGSLTLEEGTAWGFKNSLYVGGRGYSYTGTEPGQDGTVTVGKDAVITVGNGTRSSGGHHVDVGNSGSDITGTLNVNGGAVNAAQLIVGYTKATGIVNVTDGGKIQLSTDGVDDRGQIGLQVGMNGGTGRVNLDNGKIVDTTGQYAFVGAYGGSADVTLTNKSSLELSAGIYAGYDNAKAKITVDDTSSLSVAYLYLYGDGSSLENHGTVTLGEGDSDYCYVTEGTTIYNDGVMDTYTYVRASGTIIGSGTQGETDMLGSLVVGGTLEGGNAPGTQTYTGNLGLWGGSETTFSISDLTTPATDTVNGWGSLSHSMIKMEEGSRLILTEATKFVLEFGGEELLADATPGQEVDFGGFELLLVQGGVGESVAALCDTLLANTTFNFTLNPLESTSPTWATTIKGAYYEVRDNNLYLVAKVVPEPATATLSLLALAALAARRRR